MKSFLEKFVPRARKNFQEKNKIKMKWNKLKGTGGFGITWLMILIFSVVMFYYDLKIGILGFLVCIAFGFVGFDMIGYMCKKIVEGKKETSKSS